MNLFHGLLFQNGHIADPKLAMLLGRSHEASEEIASVPPASKPAQHRRASRLRWLIEELVAGRPARVEASPR